jgi:phospholipid/cholesterol/gamma-HCH transport system substrate-binding protein
MAKPLLSMTKISNETKIGVLAVVALAALILGFNFLKGTNLIHQTKHFYAVFDNVEGLEVSNAVQIDGLNIGNITAINASDKDLSNGIVVTITLNKDVHIPRNSIGEINSGFISSATIVINRGDDKQYLESGDTLETKQKANLFAQVQSSVNPVILKLGGTLTSLDSLIEVIGTMFDPRLKNNFSTIIANLAASSAQLQKFLNAENGALAQSLKNVSDFTGNLAKDNDKINHTLDNLEKASDSLAASRIPQTVESLRATMGDLRAAINKINSPNGTLGLLINDKRLYQNLESTTRSLNILLDDFRMHPKRYVNISVFGKKDKTGPLTAPLSDSAASKPVNE